MHEQTVILKSFTLWVLCEGPESHINAINISIRYLQMVLVGFILKIYRHKYNFLLIK